MPDVVQHRTINLKGRVIRSQKLTVSGDEATYQDPSVPAAKTGSLTTRTNDTTGTLTMAGGHGFLTGDLLAVFWSGGAASYVTAGTVAGNSVPITVSVGDVLPAQGTSVTAMVYVVRVMNIPSADVVAAQCSITASVRAFVLVTESGDTPTRVIALGPVDDYAWNWVKLEDGVNSPYAPFASTIGKLKFAHEDSTSSHKIYADLVY
jgi:hypothetical protein